MTGVISAAGCGDYRQKSPSMARRYDKRPPEPTVAIRHGVQLGFLLLNVWIGAQFYLWVRYIETAGGSLRVSRPPGVEGWLPIAALMNLKYFVLTGDVPGVHPAAMFLLIAFLGLSIAFRKSFCGWLCPIGTLSEWLWRGGRSLFGRTFALPRWADVPLRSLKYGLLGLFVWAVASMSVEELSAFLSSPYGLVADVKMLDLFRRAGPTTVQICSALVILSVISKNAWCRYLCPYGALIGLTSLISPTRIMRDPVSCIDCGKCTTACPSLIPVDRLRSVRTPECNGCLTCVSVCPVRDALELRTVVGRRRVTAPQVAAGVVLIFCVVVGYARVAGYWHGHVPEELFFHLVPQAAGLSHP
jgi:polyferredoxin